MTCFEWHVVFGLVGALGGFIGAYFIVKRNPKVVGQINSAAPKL